MSAKMKILIGYDGQNPITRIINDLKQAGLPKHAEAFVLTVVDAFMPLDVNYGELAMPGPTVAVMETARETARARIGKEVRQARKVANQATMQIQAVFPHWTVHSDGCADSPAWAIINKAAECDIDLVVVGSHNQSKLTTFFLGSTAQKVVTEAPCAVRVIHVASEETNSPVRIVIGADGSSDSERAVQSVAQRAWRKGSAVHLVTVLDARVATAAAAPNTAAEKWMEIQDTKELAWIQRMSDVFEKQLKDAGLTVSTLVKEGDPKRLLVEEGERWGADCIFVGARGLSMFERFFLGSVSAAVAGRAHCSVEVVREKRKQ